jgi:hypothetical protein
MHGLKVWLFTLGTFLPLTLLMDRVPYWASVLIFLAYALLVLMPVTFAVGPIGRRLGRALNEKAVAEARAEREALGGKRAAYPGSVVPSGPGGEPRL